MPSAPFAVRHLVGIPAAVCLLWDSFLHVPAAPPIYKPKIGRHRNNKFTTQSKKGPFADVHFGADTLPGLVLYV
jgi:hypothetical protein